MTEDMNTDVLIVGAGPAGLSMAVALARVGLRSLVVEKRSGPSPYPRSTVLSTRTMQVFRQWQIDEQIMAGRIPAAAVVLFAPRLGAPPVREIPFGVPSPDEVAELSPIPPILCPQDHVEPCLLQAAAQSGCEVRYSHELVHWEQTDDGVSATVSDLGGDERYRVDAAYLVAADGAHSPIRQACGIDVHGRGHLTDYWSVLFDSVALADAVAGHPGAMHVTIGDQPYSGSFIRQGAKRWTFGLNSPRSDHAQNTRNAEQILEAAAGIGPIDVDVKRTFSFELAVTVADRFRHGRVFFIGDGAHRMTPIGGMGANTAIHDAVNLAWKLAATLRGDADDSLLDSYEQERLPVADRNTERSTSVDHYFQHEDLFIDLGYRIESSAVVRGDDAEGDAWAPGRLMPHRWLADRVREGSTLDELGTGWVLLCDAASTACAAAEAIGQGTGISAFVFERQEGDPHLGHEAILVRPDGVIAWRGSPDTASWEQLRLHRRELGVPAISPLIPMPA